MFALRVIHAATSVGSVDVGRGALASQNFMLLFEGVSFGTVATTAAADAGTLDPNGYLLAVSGGATWSMSAHALGVSPPPADAGADAEGGIPMDAGPTATDLAVTHAVHLPAGIIGTLVMIDGPADGGRPGWVFCNDQEAPVGNLQCVQSRHAMSCLRRRPMKPRVRRATVAAWGLLGVASCQGGDGSTPPTPPLGTMDAAPPDAALSDSGTHGDAGGGDGADGAIPADASESSVEASCGPATSYVSVLAFGARGDGRNDDQSAIQAAFDFASAHSVAVYLPPGRYLHSDLLNANGIVIFGAGETTILTATTFGKEALYIRGSAPALYDIVLSGVATSRLSSNDSAQAMIQDASNFNIENVHVISSSSAGIFTNVGTHGYIAHNTVEGTQADGIATTATSQFIDVEFNHTIITGDDAISVTTYADDAGYTHDVTIENNTVTGNWESRSITVNGGYNITIRNNYIDGGTAGISVGATTAWNSLQDHDVLVDGNTIRNTTFTGEGTIGGGALHLYNNAGGSDYNITMTNNDVYLPAHDGIFVWGTDPIAAVVQGTKIYADASHPVVVNADSAATQVTLSGNVALDPRPTPATRSAGWRRRSFARAPDSRRFYLLRAGRVRNGTARENTRPTLAGSGWRYPRGTRHDDDAPAAVRRDGRPVSSRSRESGATRHCEDTQAHAGSDPSLLYDNYNALAIGFAPGERSSEGIFSIALFPPHASLFFSRAPNWPIRPGGLVGAETW